MQLDGFYSCRPAFQWVPMRVSRNTMDVSVCQSPSKPGWCSFGGGGYTSLWDSAFTTGGFAQGAIADQSKAEIPSEYMRVFKQLEALKMKYFTLDLCQDYADPNCAFPFDMWELTSYAVPQSSARNVHSPDSYLGIGLVRNKCRGMSIVSGGFSGCPQNMSVSTNSNFDSKTSLFGMCSTPFEPPIAKATGWDYCGLCQQYCPNGIPASASAQQFCNLNQCKKFCMPQTYFQCGTDKCMGGFGQGAECENCWESSTVLLQCAPTRWVRPVTAANAKGSGGFGSWSNQGVWDQYSPELMMQAAYESPNMMMNTFAWPSFSYLQMLKSPLYPPTGAMLSINSNTQFRLGSAMFNTAQSGMLANGYHLCCGPNTFPTLSTQSFEACFGDDQCFYGNCANTRPGCTTQNRNSGLQLQTQHEVLAYNLTYASGTPGIPEDAFVTPAQETVSELQWSCHAVQDGNRMSYPCEQQSPSQFIQPSQNAMMNLTSLVLAEPYYSYLQGLMELFMGTPGTGPTYSAGDLKSSADADATCEFTFTGKCERGWFLALNVPSQTLCCAVWAADAIQRP